MSLKPVKVKREGALVDYSYSNEKLTADESLGYEQKVRDQTASAAASG